MTAHNPDTRDKLAICEKLRAEIVIDPSSGLAALINPDGPEAADTIEALVEAVEPLALLFYGGGVNMNDPLHKWLTMANLQAANDALSRARNGGEQ